MLDLQARAETHGGQIRSLRDHSERQTREMLALEHAVSQARAERDRLVSERTERDLAAAEESAERSRRRGWRLLVPETPFASGVLVGLAAVAIVLAVLAVLNGRSLASASRVETATPAIDPSSPSAAIAIDRDAPSPTSAPPTQQTASPPSVDSAEAPEPIDLAAYAAIEAAYVRRIERPQYRITAKLRMPREIRAWYAYQASARGWTKARQEAELANPESLPARYRFEGHTYVEVLLEDFGMTGSFDVNSIAASFRWRTEGAEVPALVSSFHEPEVITGDVADSPRIKAMTLGLEFPLATTFPAVLSFHPIGSESTDLTWEAAP